MKKQWAMMALIGVLASGCAIFGKKKNVDPVASGCSSTREYVTTLEFLRESKAFGLSESDARSIAEKVAQGCTGSARRFVKVSSLLSQMELSGKDAIQAGVDVSKLSDDQTEAFVEIFSRFYLRDHLDLDVRESYRAARALSLDFKGDAKRAQADFVKLTQFCVEEKGLDLPRPQCGRMAAKIASLGAAFDGELAPAYLELYRYLTDETGLKLTTGTAMKMAEELIAFGPATAENFKQAYDYAVAEKGLALPAPEAMQFAKKLAALGANPAVSTKNSN